MSYKVETITNFRKEAKKLIQKYPSLTTEIENIGIFTDPLFQLFLQVNWNFQ